MKRLKASTELIDDITDKSCLHAADIELLGEEDLLSSQTYQEDRKTVKSEIKKLAINTVLNIHNWSYISTSVQLKVLEYQLVRNINV